MLLGFNLPFSNSRIFIPNVTRLRMRKKQAVSADYHTLGTVHTSMAMCCLNTITDQQQWRLCLFMFVFLQSYCSFNLQVQFLCPSVSFFLSLSLYLSVSLTWLSPSLSIYLSVSISHSLSLLSLSLFLQLSVSITSIPPSKKPVDNRHWGEPQMILFMKRWLLYAGLNAIQLAQMDWMSFIGQVLFIWRCALSQVWPSV